MTILEIAGELSKDLEKFRNGEISAAQLKLTEKTTSTIFRGIAIAVMTDSTGVVQIESNPE